MRKLYPYIRPFLLPMLFGVLFKGIGAVTDLLIPYFMGVLIDQGIGTGDNERIIFLCLCMLGLTLATAGFNILANYVSAYASQGIGEGMRNALYQKIQTLPLWVVDRLTASSLITRVTNDVEHVQRTLLMMTRFMIRAPIMAIGGVALSLLIDPLLTLIVFVGMILLGAASISVYKVTRPIYRKVQASIDRLTTILRENLTGIRVIKSFDKTGYETDRFDRQSRTVKHFELKAGMFNAYMSPSIAFISSLTTAAVLYAGGYRVLDGGIEIGQIVTILNYVNMILMAMTMIPRMFMMFSRANTSAARINEILDSKDQIRFGRETTPLTETPLLEFRSVSYSYPNATAQALHNVSFTLTKGQTIAVIGGTGAGKTTLLGLILRLYEPTCGEIFLEGRPIADYTKDYLLSRITAAMQQYHIFGMSVRDNIVLDMDPDEERLRQSAAAAQLSELIDQLDYGYEHKIAQAGSNLSGGQKQRLSIARTLYRPAELVVLDDVSSALDYRTDLRLRTALRRTYQDKTVILISQRIASVQSADRILVLEKGRCVGFASHEELIRSNEVYRDICRTQGVSFPDGGEAK